MKKFNRKVPMILIFLSYFLYTVEGKVGTCTEVSLTDLEEPHVVLLASLIILLSVLVRVATQFLKLPIPHSAWMAVFGIAFGYIATLNNCLFEYTSAVEVNCYDLLAVVLPLTIFRTAFCIDTHCFVRSLSQTLVIATFGVFFNATFTGYILSTAREKKWSAPMCYMFGAACTPIHPHDVIVFLKDIGYQVKPLVTLLEAESMIGLATTILIYNLMDDMVLQKDNDTSHIILMVFWSLVIAPIVGYILGKLAAIMIQIGHNSITHFMLWTVAVVYLGYYICEKVLDCSGVLSVITIGIIMSFERHGFSTEVDEILTDFWDLLASIAYTALLFIVSLLCGRNLAPLMGAKEVAALIVTYIVIHISRFFSLLIMAPILSKLGYGFTLNKLIIMLWSDVKGAQAASLASLGLNNFYNEFGISLFGHTIGLMVMTLFINVPTLSIILSLLDMSQLTLARMNNMDTCVRYVLSRRERSIAMLKMDRFLSDANWPLVQTATKIKHPYRARFDATSGDNPEQDEVNFGNRQTICPDCQKEVQAEPTPKEMLDMTREARQRVLKAKKISYVRQYENRLLSKDAIRVLTTTVELAASTSEALIKLDALLKVFNKKGFAYHTRKKLLKLFYRKSSTLRRRPRYRFRVWCYLIITSKAFDLVMSVVTILNMVPLIAQLIAAAKGRALKYLWLDIINQVFCLIYFCECIAKIFGMAHTYLWDHGIKPYFRSGWNMFEFCLLISNIIQVTMEGITQGNKKSTLSRNSHFYIAILCVNMLRIFRLVRLMPMFKAWYPKLVKWCDSRIDEDIAFAYEMGKGFVTAEQEIMEKLPQMIDNVHIRDDMRRRMDKDRMIITKELGVIQKDKPWIAITVKTKQAMRSTVNSMMQAVGDLKLSGWVDDFEYTLLCNVLQDRLKTIHRIKSIQPSEPKVIFSEVAWMKGDATITDFLYQNVRNKVYDQGDYVCTEGEFCEGIFIVITGILRLSYVPNMVKLEQFEETGCLPIMDYLSTMNFDMETEDYIVTGNTVGVLATLTGRAYDCNIIAETPSQVFVLDKVEVAKAIKKCRDPVRGVEAKMWKEATLGLAVTLLSEVPAYQSMTKEKIKMILERGFVPNLSNFKVLTVTDKIQDIILLEGIVTDYITRENFIAPCHIQRTVQRIILPKSSQAQIHTNVETKLLIIPMNDVDEYDLMVNEEEVSELVSTSSEKCLQHAIQSRFNLGKTKRGRAMKVQRQKDSDEAPVNKMLTERRRSEYFPIPESVENMINAEKRQSTFSMP